MRQELYHKIIESANQGLRVSLITTIKGEYGKQSDDMRKTLMIRSEKFLYDCLNIVQDGENTVIYEPLKGMGKENGLLHFADEVKSDLDFSVIENLARLREPAAVATVLGAEAGTEYGAGAKIVVTKAGKQAGCLSEIAEHFIIPRARAMIGTGTYQICRLDCGENGGATDVLLEDI